MSRNYNLVHSVRVCTEFVPEVFGRLTTLGPKFLVRANKKYSRRAMQVCACVCGAVVAVQRDSLVRKLTQSCGCLHHDTLVNLNTTHGMSETVEYTTWSDMIKRCEDLTDSNYGGRGIKVCDRWKKFSNFFVDVGKRPSPAHSLDRFPDLDGNYEPSNCRWATPEQQANNRRSNVLLEFGGKSMTLSQWSKIIGRHKTTIRGRLISGMSIAQVLDPETRHNKKRKSS